MSTPAIAPPPQPDTQDITPELGPASRGSGSTMDRFRGIINQLSGGGIPAIQERLSADFAKRQHDAALYNNVAKTNFTYLTHAKQTVGPNAPYGINPITGQPATAQNVQEWQNNYDTGTQQYLKLLPKDAKPIAQKLLEVGEHVIGRKGAHGAPAGQSSNPLTQQGGDGSVIPPPPQGASAPASPTPAPAPSGPAVPPPPSASQNAMELPASLQPSVLSQPETQRMTGVQNELAAAGQATQQQNTLANANIAPKAQAQTSADIAQLSQAAPDMAPEQKQNLLMRKLGYVPPPKMVTKLMADPDSPTGWSNVSYDQLTSAVYARQPNAPAPRGTLVTDTVTKDPYGNYTVSTRTPIVPGVSTPSSDKPSGGGGGTTGGGKLSGAKAGGGGPGGRVIPPPLDSEGHIAGVPRGYTPQSVEGANRLLDGAPTSDLPTPSRAMSGQLARQYGWNQGKFTPKEQTQIREASTFIQDALQNTDALSALDGDTMDRAVLAQVTSNPDKEGFIGRTLTSAAAQNMSPQQAEFVRTYNQLVGTIAGLSKLVRPGGTTEAQIERLKSELPNPVTTKNSADARQRLMRLQKEIDVAMAKGNFGSAEALKPSGRPGASSPPPSGGGKKQFYRLNGKAYDAQTNQEIRP